jgi:hypothetical protein
LFGQITIALDQQTVDNLDLLMLKLAKDIDPDLRKKLLPKQSELFGLLRDKLEVLKTLQELQSSYATNVEVNDAATLDDLQRVIDKIANFQMVLAVNKDKVPETHQPISSQLDTGSLGEAKATFEKYRAAGEKRDQLFKNFQADTKEVSDVHDSFKNALLVYLSQEIVVKEHRDRYQKEQLGRLLFA